MPLVLICNRLAFSFVYACTLQGLIDSVASQGIAAQHFNKKTSKAFIG